MQLESPTQMSTVPAVLAGNGVVADLEVDVGVARGRGAVALGAAEDAGGDLRSGMVRNWACVWGTASPMVPVIMPVHCCARGDAEGPEERAYDGGRRARPWRAGGARRMPRVVSKAWVMARGDGVIASRVGAGQRQSVNHSNGSRAPRLGPGRAVRRRGRPAALGGAAATACARRSSLGAVDLAAPKRAA